MQNPVLVGKLPNGQLIYVADPDPVIPTPPIAPPLPSGTIVLPLGPQLFIDPHLLEMPGFNRVVHSPVRLGSAPILNGQNKPGPYNVANFSNSVLYDNKTGLFLMWYMGVEPTSGKTLNALITSPDGLVWGKPNWLSTPSDIHPGNTFIGTVTDCMPGLPYRFMTIIPDVGENPPGPTWQGVSWFSQDGILWERGAVNPIVPNRYGEEWTQFFVGFGLIHRWNKAGYTWKDSSGVSHTNTSKNPFVRCIGLAGPLVNGQYSASSMLFSPGASDPGETQFYYVSNIIQRGDLFIGVMGTLREDIVVSGAPSGSFGTGYSTLVWSRDGVSWSRYDGLDPHFFDPSPLASSWDHAMAWIDSIVPVGDSVLMYYGGYQWGHKVGTDRQIGIAKIGRDRFVSRHASAATVLRTKLVNFDAGTLSINFSGQIRVSITDENYALIPGFDCIMTGDWVEANVLFSGDLKSLSTRAVHLEFQLTSADLYAFYLK